jgi:uncharacterized surface anchored protein
MRTVNHRTFILLALTALIVGACGTPSFSIGNYTWLDENMNGKQDKGEGPLANVKVELYSGDRSQLQATTSSDKDGLYSFQSLSAGDYLLKFTPPGGFDITQKDVGEDDSVDSDIFSSGNMRGWTETVTIGPDLTDDVDAGFFTSSPLPTPTPTPQGVIQSPTGQPITATPANSGGSAQVDLLVETDKAGHKNFVALGDTTTVEVKQSEGEVTLTFASDDGATQITLIGPVDEYGAVDLAGTGMVATFTNVSGTFTGTVEIGPDGTLLVNGMLTLGGNGELPQGEPIVYQVSS